ncbi:MAG: hypothetical protein IPP72_11795 [Chitinophagaceae bacterium]|nr:hypothetical protein [Chitinophagaceae bacterium]
MSGLIDIILFPLYVALFALLFAARRKRIKDPVLKKYHRNGFWIKVFSALAYIIFSTFLAKVDSTYLYYPEGINIAKLILKDFTNIKLLFISGKDFDPNLLADTFNKGYFSSESNFFVARLVTVLSFVSFGSYSVITLFFSMISFSGVWRLYKFFYEQYPHLHKQLAIAVLYLPNFVFWSSGILKDPLCTGMLGWFTYSMYKIFIQRESIIKNSIVVIISAAVLAVVKAYILASYLPFFMLYVILTNLKNIKRPFVRLVLLFLIVITIAGGSFLVGERLQEEMGNFAVTKLTESVQTTQQSFMRIADLAESSFSIGEFDGTPAGFLKIAPAGIAATLYRPYLWESKKVSTLMSSLESLALMLFTLYVFLRAGPFFFFGSIIKDPMIMYCLLFAIIFALFVGVTTLNFGTLVRYKIPCMPFYLIGLVLILERHKKKLQKAVLKETGEPAVS